MNTTIAPEIREVLEALHYRPAVSIILPFEPKMGLKAELQYSLKHAAKKVQDALQADYPPELSDLVMQKLQQMIDKVDYNTYKKSIAIFVSPVFQKLLYLDVPVEERIIVDESFEIRDLIYSKKQLHKYLLLLLSGKEMRMYLGNGGDLVRIVADRPEQVEAYENDIAERVTNFSDVSDRKEVMMEKFLRHADQSLDVVLNAYPLPLFVLGTDRILGRFKQLTKHQKAIVNVLHGNYEEASMVELKKVIDPVISDWKKVKVKDLLNRIEEAANKKKLAVGIKAVWHDAIRKKGQLLIVEKNYMYPAQHSDTAEHIEGTEGLYNRFSYIKDAVDDVMEKILEYGGDVEFVDEGVLDAYEHIVLVNYY